MTELLIVYSVISAVAAGLYGIASAAWHFSWWLLLFESVVFGLTWPVWALVLLWHWGEWP